MIDEKIAEIEKQIAEIKDYQKKLLKSTRKSFDDVMGFIRKNTELNIDNGKSIIKSKEEIIRLSEKLQEIQQWKSELLPMLNSILDIEKNMQKQIERLSERKSFGF